MEITIHHGKLLRIRKSQHVLATDSRPMIRQDFKTLVVYCKVDN